MSTLSKNGLFFGTLAVVYFLAVSLGHLAFSEWLVKQRVGPFGPMSFQDFVPYLAVLGALLLGGRVIADLRAANAPRRLALFWGFWLLCVFMVDRYLTYSVNEYAHYPQYALLAWLLARAMDPDKRRMWAGRILFWTTLLGIIDETQQYLWLAPSHGAYLDINDFLVNLLGAAAGVMLYYGREVGATSSKAKGRPWTEAGVSLLLAAVLGMGLITGRLALTPNEEVPPGGIAYGDDGWTIYLERLPDTYGSWNKGPYRGRYWILPPAQGAILLLLSGFLFTRLAQHRPRQSEPPRTDPSSCNRSLATR